MRNIKSYLIPIGLMICLLANIEVYAVQGFSLTGEIKGLKDGSRIMILCKRPDIMDTVSLVIVKGERFTIKNIQLPITAGLYVIRIQTEFVDDLLLFLGQNEDVKLAGALKDWPNVTVTGSTSHKDYLECKELRKELQKKGFYLKYPDGFASADTINMYMLEECKEMIRQSPASFYLAYWLVTMKNPVEDTYPQYKILPEMKKPLYEMLSLKVKASYYGRLLAKQIAEHTGN